MTTIEQINTRSQGTLPGLIGVEFTGIEPGRATTQIWDAQVTDEASGKTIALFRCTQLILYPRST